MSKPFTLEEENERPPSRVTDPRLNQTIMPDSSYNLRMKEEQQQKQVAEKVRNINRLRENIPYDRSLSEYVGLMNFVEKLLHACGGEAKANFVEVARDFMKLATRVPMKANLHTFMAEDSKDNPRFHKVVTQILLEVTMIGGIRWIPTAEGTFLVLSIKRD